MKNLYSLKLNKEFKRAYYQGKFKPHPLLVTYMVKNNLGIVRIGITTSKKVGKANQRNRARRVIRQAFINTKDKFDFKSGYDIVFVARQKTTECKTYDLEKVMLKHFSVITQNK